MKRFCHYNKDTAIILSSFGSIPEREKYEGFKKFIENEYPELPVYLPFASRSVLKALAKKDIHYKSLAQVLADVDLEGYRKIVVSSVNIFPTDEHDYVLKTVKGFKEFSLSRIRNTGTLFTKTRSTNKILKELDDKLKEKYQNKIFLYIVHGAPYLDQLGGHSILYVRDFLKSLSPFNIFCSLEHDFQFDLVRDALLEEIKKLSAESESPLEVKIVPILLSSGNHFKKDITVIKEFIGNHYKVSTVESLLGTGKFNLLELDFVRQEFKRQIKEEIYKLQ